MQPSASDLTRRALKTELAHVSWGHPHCLVCEIPGLRHAGGPTVMRAQPANVKSWKEVFLLFKEHILYF